MISLRLPLFASAMLAAFAAQAGAQAIYQGPGTYSTYGNTTYGPSGTQVTFGNQTFTSGGTYTRQGNQAFGPNGTTTTTQPVQPFSAGPITKPTLTSSPIAAQSITGNRMLGGSMTSPQSILTPSAKGQTSSAGGQGSSAGGQTFVAGPNGQSGACSTSGNQTFCN